MKQLVYASFTLVLAFSAFAGSEKKPLRELMNEFYLKLIDLRPYMTSQDKFVDPKNAPTIQGHLKSLSDLAQEIGHPENLKSPSLSISKQVLARHVTDLERVYRVGNKQYARWMLNSTLFVCMSCHVQVPGQKSIDISNADHDISKPSETLETAEFLFATRQFESALNIYDKLIASYPRPKLSGSDVETALRRKVAYYAQVKRDPEAGLKGLLDSLKNKKLPEFVIKNGEAWVALFREWSREPKFDSKSASPAELKKYVEDKLKVTLWDKLTPATEPRVVTLFQITGILTDFLQKNPDSPMLPEVLYWLALCDQRLNNEFFFSLSDIYLKECIERSKERSIAEKCYKELRKNTVLSYTGSRGTFLPDDVQAELKTYEEMISKKPTAEPKK